MNIESLKQANILQQQIVDTRSHIEKLKCLSPTEILAASNDPNDETDLVAYVEDIGKVMEFIIQLHEQRLDEFQAKFDKL